MTKNRFKEKHKDYDCRYSGKTGEMIIHKRGFESVALSKFQWQNQTEDDLNFALEANDK